MPKLNPYLIKENYQQVEEVREIQNEIPSYEEFMKTYEPSEEVEILIEAEYQDRVLHGPQYGPENEQSKNYSKGVGRNSASNTYCYLSAGGVSSRCGVASTGAVTAIAGAVDKDPELTVDGLEIFSMGMESAVKGAVNSSSHKGSACSLPICPKK